jgi:hypothetical protein
MTNRREFLQAAAITALPAVAGATPVIGRQNRSLHSVVVDQRRAEGRTFGARLAAAGLTVHAIPQGDVTQVWLQHIGPAWKQQPVAVAGLTGLPVLFCLEQVALGGGLRVVFHAEHIVHPGGETEHSLLRGAEAADLSLRDLTRAGPLWPAVVANAISTHREQLGRARPGRSNAAFAPELPPGAQLLTSWIIASA